jgi:hypothetical protein
MNAPRLNSVKLYLELYLQGEPLTGYARMHVQELIEELTLEVSELLSNIIKEK